MTWASVCSTNCCSVSKIVSRTSGHAGGSATMMTRLHGLDLVYAIRDQTHCRELFSAAWNVAPLTRIALRECVVLVSRPRNRHDRSSHGNAGLGLGWGWFWG